VSVDELFSRGNFAMQVGQNEAAIAEFEQVLKSRPEHAAAWGKLAFLYLKQHQNQKAVQAFKKAKGLGDANGGVVTRDGSRGLQLQ
jgi:Tfp pilus assembly protein PilF